MGDSKKKLKEYFNPQISTILKKEIYQSQELFIL